jgi:hypothetical protein
MKKHRGLVVLALSIVLLCALSLGTVFGEDVLKLSGITIKDEHPNGCVDCHKVAGEGQDYRLNVELAAAGHPDISKIVKTVPEDCAMCHKTGAKAGALNTQAHHLHYVNPDENHFIAYYFGDCLACHALNVATGEMSVKSGPKNW